MSYDPIEMTFRGVWANVCICKGTTLLVFKAVMAFVNIDPDVVMKLVLNME
jgi:hypothetical protein